MELTSLVRAAKGSREQQVDSVTGDSGHGNESLLPAPSCQPGRTQERGSSSKGRAGGHCSPCGSERCRDSETGLEATGTAPFSPLPYSIKGFFLTGKKKKKAQAKTVINIRANSEVFGQSHGSAASTRTSTASLEVTGSTGGIPALHPTPNLLPAQSRGTRGLCIPPSLGSSKFFPNHLPTHKTFCAPLICVISLS